MKRQFNSSLLALFITIIMTQNAVMAATTGGGSDDDSDVRMVDARVVEVTERRISVVARSGVEHVIAIDSADTNVKIEGQQVSLADVREGDVITIELDEIKPVKFAKNIVIAPQANGQMARNRR